MKVLILFIVLLSPPVALAKDTQMERTILNEYVQIYRSVKTPHGLFLRLYPHQDASLMAALNGQGFYQPLPALKYDPDRLELSTKDFKLRFVDMRAGIAQINGEMVTYDNNEPFLNNTERIFRKLSSTKHSTWSLGPLLSEAIAGATDFPTHTPDEFNPAIETVHGCMMIVPEVIFQGGAITAGFVAKAAIGIPLLALGPLHYGVKKAVAYSAPSCEKQAQDLRKILDSGGISIAAVRCANLTLGLLPSVFKTDTKIPIPLAVDHHAIEFWTRDQQRVTMYADWLTQRACVSNKEVFSFDRTKLVNVSIATKGSILGKTITGKNPDFIKYKTRIEPYRKVLEYFGRNESCHRCGDDFNQLLARDKPGKYRSNTDEESPSTR